MPPYFHSHTLLKTMPSIAQRLEIIHGELDQVVLDRRAKVLTDLEAKLSEQIENSYQKPDIQPTLFYVTVPLHDKDKSHFVQLCVDGVIARQLGYYNHRVPSWTWECKTEVRKRYKYEWRADMTGQDAIHVGWDLAITITKKETEKKKTRRTTPQHELPQYLRTDYGADGGC